MGVGHGKFDSAELVCTFSGQFSEKYEIIRQLGAGAQGAAYLVRDKDAKEMYVAKETHDMTPDGKAEFKKEFEKMRALHHPHCAKVIELVEGKDIIDGEWKDQIFIISELAKGGDLTQFTQKVVQVNGSLTEEWIAGVFKQAMRGVSYIHSKRIVHNDLKPDNILMLDEFNPKLPRRIPAVVINDFGCATLAKDNFFLCGDPRYQSPETWEVMKQIISGREGTWHKMGPKADVWSMAATLFELLSGGLLPFIYRPCSLSDIRTEGFLDELGEAVLNDVEIRPHCNGISPAAEELLKAMFIKDPQSRPSAVDVLGYSWFSIKGHRVADAVNNKLEFNVTKGLAHRILLNALATKVQRDHYQACWKAFNDVDQDQSGQINLEEFKVAFSKIDADGDAETRFRQADLDGDEALDFNEFMAVTFNWKALDPKVLEKHLHKLFVDLDKDGTGNISESELREIFQGALSYDEVARVFKRIDVDGDGSVSLKELAHFLFEPPTKEELKRLQQNPEINRGMNREAEFFGGVVLPIAVFACLCFSGLWKCFV
mmetsp:Transcript_76971/g.213939  ORF Transcript_76971/g.213939 Transcript_76971/m.213939 type:complete len:543 (-) Transcript_76971:88-1716(-)